MFSLVAVLLICILFILLLVRRGAVLTPREALANYLRAVHGGRTEEAYNYLSAADKDRQNRADYQAAHALGSGLIADLLGRHFSFAIDNIEETGDAATAAVSITAPDFRKMLGDIFHHLNPERLPKQPLLSLTFLCRHLSGFLDKYRQDNLPMQTTRATYRLCREEAGWKIADPPEAYMPTEHTPNLFT